MEARLGPAKKEAERRLGRGGGSPPPPSLSHISLSFSQDQNARKRLQFRPFWMELRAAISFSDILLKTEDEWLPDKILIWN